LHAAPVLALAFSPAAGLVISADARGTIECWAPDASTSFAPPAGALSYDSKLDTDLFALVRARAVPSGLAGSPDGRLLAVDARTPRWPAHVVHLGALGVVTRVTLALVPAFALRQDVFEGLPWDVGVGHLRALLAGGYSVSLFTTWAAPLQFQVWRKSLVANGGDGGGGGSGGGGGGASGAQSDDGVTAVAPDDAAAARGGAGAPSSGAPDADAWFGAPRATEDRHPIPGVDAAPCTRQCGEPGPWHARLPHFRAEFTPSVGAELQSEYFVGTADAPAALCALALCATSIQLTTGRTRGCTRCGRPPPS
jgi:hypothetical protein